MFRSELLAFLKAIWKHWKWVVGGATVAFFQVCYGIWQQESRPMIGWILLVAGLAGAVFLAWRDEYRQKNDSLKQLESFRESKDDKRRKARENMFQSCMAMLKNESPIFSFHVVIRHKAYNLDDNDEVNWLCDEIGKTTYEHPFTNIGSCVPKKDRKEFLRWTDLFTDYDVISGNSADHYLAAEQWRVEHNYPNPTQQERVDSAFTRALGPPSVTASKQPLLRALAAESA